MDKRGGLEDYIIFIIFIFIGAIIFIAYSYTFTKVAFALNSTSVGINVNNETQAAIDNLNDMATTQLNSAYVIFFGGLIFLQFMSAFLIRQHPVFLIIYFFLMVLAGLLAIYLGNAFDTIQQIPEFASTFASQPVLSWVLDNILIISVVTDIITMLILFAKVGQVTTV